MLFRSHSLCFGVFDDENNQVGFARVVSDLAVFVWLMDVFILANQRGKGLGKLLIKEIINYPALQDVKNGDWVQRMHMDCMKNLGLNILQNQQI